MQYLTIFLKKNVIILNKDYPKFIKEIDNFINRIRTHESLQNLYNLQKIHFLTFYDKHILLIYIYGAWMEASSMYYFEEFEFKIFLQYVKIILMVFLIQKSRFLNT